MNYLIYRYNISRNCHQTPEHPLYNTGTAQLIKIQNIR